MPAAPRTPQMGARRALLVSAVGAAVVAPALYLWWPAGVVIGLLVGLVVVLALGRQQERAAEAVPLEDPFRLLGLEAEPAPESEPEVRVLQATPLAARAHEPVSAARAAIAAPAAPAAAPSPEPASASAPAAAAARPAEQGVRADLDRLKADLGDDYPDFARAARLVVSTQYASAARLQRDLQLPYSRARRLLADLESEHFVGPATGTLPRQVLLPKERLPEVERLFAGV